MAYSYKRTHVVASTHHILDMIVKKAVNGRNVEALVRAYNDEMEEDWEDSHSHDERFEGSLADLRRWQTKTFGILHTREAVEKAMATAFVELYIQLAKTGATRATALEVFDFPDGFPEEGVPKHIAVMVGEALAREDAAGANYMLREMSKDRRQL